MYGTSCHDEFTQNVLCGIAGRDSNRNLQKALKVGKTRDRMPAIIDKLRSEMTAWEEVGVLWTLCTNSCQHYGVTANKDQHVRMAF